MLMVKVQVSKAGAQGVVPRSKFPFPGGSGGLASAPTGVLLHWPGQHEKSVFACQSVPATGPWARTAQPLSLQAAPEIISPDPSLPGSGV